MSGRTVYLVDDDQAVLDSTAFLLDSFGMRCEAFADPVAFLDRAERLAPGCIVTDLRMPEMNGWELCAALRARSVGWPILLVTSDGSAEAEALARRHGFCALLRKPVRAEALAAALEDGFSLLERR